MRGKGDTDREIAALAARQDGVVARRQLEQLGLSNDAIDRRLAAGPTQFERDRERDALLTINGWRVLRFTWSQITRRPQWVARALDLAHRNARGSRPWTSHR